LISLFRRSTSISTSTAITASFTSFAGVANPWELGRLAPGERVLDIADVTIQNPVSAEGRRNIDLWTG
jgi:hypothetical protein